MRVRVRVRLRLSEGESKGEGEGKGPAAVNGAVQYSRLFENQPTWLHSDQSCPLQDHPTHGEIFKWLTPTTDAIPNKSGGKKDTFATHLPCAPESRQGAACHLEVQNTANNECSQGSKSALWQWILLCFVIDSLQLPPHHLGVPSPLLTTPGRALPVWSVA